MAKKPIKKHAGKKVRAVRRKKTTSLPRGYKPAKPIGRVTHHYANIGVGIVKFAKAVRVGATVQFRGATTDFTQTISSMQYDHKDIVLAPKGKEVGVKVKKRVREGDEVFEAQ